MICVNIFSFIIHAKNILKKNKRNGSHHANVPVSMYFKKCFNNNPVLCNNATVVMQQFIIKLLGTINIALLLIIYFVLASHCPAVYTHILLGLHHDWTI